MEAIRVTGNDTNSNSLCNVLLRFTSHETPLGTEFVILQGVQIEPTSYSTLLIDVDLSDKETKKHFKEVLQSNNQCNVFDSLEQAIADEKEWHEAYDIEIESCKNQWEKVA